MTATKNLRVALLGHPNVGKTTLFNALTGAKAQVGNYPGVTVECRVGQMFTPHGHKVELIDLPGVYSLVPSAPDGEVTRDVLLGQMDGEGRPDLVVCVVDMKDLERHLGLVVQAMDLGLPMILALTKVDRAGRAGFRVDLQSLRDTLGISVVEVAVQRGKGLVELKQALRLPFPTAPKPAWVAHGRLAEGLEQAWQEAGIERGTWLQLLTDSQFRAGHAELEALTSMDEEEREHLSEEVSQLRARKAYEVAHLAIHEPSAGGGSFTDLLDRYVLHPWLGWLVFAALMAGVFWSIFRLATYPMDWIEAGVGWIAGLVANRLPEGEFTDLLTEGVIGGVGSVLVFIPQIALLFFFLAVLESSGYLTRAAYLMDKVMAHAGLSGRAFLPLLSAYACAIPGVMATRTISNAKERLLTILILPWMSCSARLPVYFLLVPLLIQGAGKQTLALFGIYALGTLTALVAARLLKRPVGGKEYRPSFIMEMPIYQWPDWHFVFSHVGMRVWAFVRKAGTLILALSIILWALQAYPRSNAEGDGAGQEQYEQSYMGRLGSVIEPVVAPLGWDGRLGTAVLTSFAAREVFVSSLAISYAVDEEDHSSLRKQLRSQHQRNQKLTFATALSLLVFFIYALQCLPTTAVVQRETQSWKWALGQLVGMTLFAWLAAFLVFQFASILL